MLTFVVDKASTALTMITNADDATDDEVDSALQAARRRCIEFLETTEPSGPFSAGEVEKVHAENESKGEITKLKEEKALMGSVIQAHENCYTDHTLQIKKLRKENKALKADYTAVSNFAMEQCDLLQKVENKLREVVTEVLKTAD